MQGLYASATPREGVGVTVFVAVHLGYAADLVEIVDHARELVDQRVRAARASHRLAPTGLGREASAGTARACADSSQGPSSRDGAVSNGSPQTDAGRVALSEASAQVSAIHGSRQVPTGCSRHPQPNELVSRPAELTPATAAFGVIGGGGPQFVVLPVGSSDTYYDPMLAAVFVAPGQITLPYCGRVH